MQSRDKKWDSFPPLEELRKEYASDCPRIDLQYGLNHEILMVPKFADEIKTLKDLYDYISVFYERVGWDPAEIYDANFYFGYPSKDVTDETLAEAIKNGALTTRPFKN
eukprot:Phypoly_transcript_15602.p1 GENE.Phypoly_transcript_15602~~Phypoly_transcript_15602.p1  ORF type:complete len:108 (+),score=15.45 Phypoly_transcript_15602:513-836(+)